MAETDVSIVDASVTDEVAATNLVPIATIDTEVTTPSSMEQFVHTDGEFSGRSSDKSIITEYDDRVPYRLWYVSYPKKFPPLFIFHSTFDLRFICTHTCFIHMHHSFMLALAN